jgi:tetratricopeptide (TPR) repeat protein
MIRQLTVIFLILLVGSGCATVNQKHYEEPLYKLDVLEQPASQNAQIGEISDSELKNQRPGRRPSLNSDEAGMWMTMDKAEDKFKTAGNLIDDKGLHEYLQGLACRVALEYCKDIRIYVLRQPYFNAMMSPNGAMMIWSGMLLRTSNEAQLASVIGHEIGHYVRRHSLQRMRDIIDTTGVMVFVQLATAAAGVGIAGDLAYLAAISKIQAYSRDQEREADGYGLAFMSRAGYDPYEISKLWKKVIKEIEASDDENFSLMMFDSHPPGEERMQALEELAGRITAQNDFNPATDDASFREHVLPLRNQFLQDELHLRDFDRTEVLLDGLIAEGVGLGELFYFEGEFYRFRNQGNDKNNALRAYDRARAEEDFPPETLRAMGMIYQELGEKDKARDVFTEYLKRIPDSADREMIEHMISKENQ